MPIGSDICGTANAVLKIALQFSTRNPAYLNTISPDRFSATHSASSARLLFFSNANEKPQLSADTASIRSTYTGSPQA